LSPTFDVLSYGTIGLDYIIHVPDWPSPAMGVHAPIETEHLGGKATNVAAFLSAWGVRVAVSGNEIGGDAVGDRLFEILEGHPNINTRYLARNPEGRSMYCRILVNPAGDRAIIGINVDESPQTAPTAAMVSDARIVTLDLYGGPERVQVARLAAEAGRPVIIGDLRRVDHPILPYTDIAIASAAEIRRDYPNMPSEKFAERIRQQGVEKTIITDAAHEIYVYDAGKKVSIMPPNVEVIDSTGAGDAFRAGVVYGVLQGLPLSECAALGAAAGSLNVEREGAASHPPTEEEVKQVASELILSSE